jgi:sulfite reductase (NADPH) flavoprotein alpha-component
MMSIASRSPMPQLVPESAPFTVEQRTWLTGFIAGLGSLENTITPLSASQSAGLKKNGRYQQDVY